MEIPVRMVELSKEQEKIVSVKQDRLIRNDTFSPSLFLENEFPQHINIINNNNIIEDLSNQQEKWISIIELHDELLKHCKTEQILVEVQPTERLLELFIRNTSFKRQITLPRFVNIHAIKVKFLRERKMILLEAPRMLQLTNYHDRRTMTLPVQFVPQCSDVFDREFVSVNDEEMKMMTPRDYCRSTFLNDKWRNDILLDEDLFQTLTLQHIRCKVDTVLRVVVVKVQRNRFTPIKRIIRVPDHVNIHMIKVTLTEEKKYIRIQAPFMTLDCSSSSSLFDRRRDLPELFTQLDEYEPVMYKLLKHIRRQCPIITPRIVRCLKTKQLLVHLDVTCNDQFRPQDLFVSVKKCQSVLVIRRWNKDCVTTTTPMNDDDLWYELNMPKHFDLSRLNTHLLNDRTLRVVMPVERMAWNGRY